MRHFRAALLLASISFSAMGADTSPKEETTQSIVEDLDRQITQADKELNAAYKKQLDRLDDTGKELLKKAERAWITFRDAQIQFEEDAARGGTLARILGLKCRLRMTKDRTEELNKFKRPSDPA